MVSKGFPYVTTSGRQYNIGEKPSVILYTYINLHAGTPKPQSFLSKSFGLQCSNCERSELLIWQVHQFELGCIKLHTPYRYKVHPKLYSDWSMCTVFYRVEFLNTFQHRVESTVVFRSSFNIMARGTHRRKKVDEKSCVTLLLCDPGWYAQRT